MTVRAARMTTFFLAIAVFAGGLGWTSRAGAGEVTYAAQSAVTRTGQVYLLRGLLNVFSLGMDALGSKVQAQGVTAGVYNHSAWASLAGSVAASYKAGRRSDPIIIVGHSLGADAAILMARRLGSEGVPVALVVTFDPVNAAAAPGNVGRFVNFYQSNNGWGHAVAPGPGFRGRLVNKDLRDQMQIGHTSIDKSDALHQAVVAEILKITRPARRRGRTAS